MALKIKYTDHRGILNINMSPTSTTPVETVPEKSDFTDLADPKFDNINHRFGSFDLFGAKYDDDGSRSLFRSRYNSIEEELANTPYAFATKQALGIHPDSHLVDITIRDNDSLSKDIEENGLFTRVIDGIFVPDNDLKTMDDKDTSAFTVKNLIHAQDRYFDLSTHIPKNKMLGEISDIKQTTRDSIEAERKFVETGSKASRILKNTDGRLTVRSGPNSFRKDKTVTIFKDKKEAFMVLPETLKEKTTSLQVAPTSKHPGEKSFAIMSEIPLSSRSSSPHSLPIKINTRSGRNSPFRGRYFKKELSRLSTPESSTASFRAKSSIRNRTHSLSRIEKMEPATKPLTTIIHTMSGPQSPRSFLMQNKEDVRELSELNREKHKAEAELRRAKEASLIEIDLINDITKNVPVKSFLYSRRNTPSDSPMKVKIQSQYISPKVTAPSAIILNRDKNNCNNRIPKLLSRKLKIKSVTGSQLQSNNKLAKHSKVPKRQSSAFPKRCDKSSEKYIKNNPKNQKFLSDTNNSINNNTKLSHMNDKRDIRKRTHSLNITLARPQGTTQTCVKLQPSNRIINITRLSPITSTPNKSYKGDAHRTQTRANDRKLVKLAASPPQKCETISVASVNKTANSHNATKQVSDTVTNETTMKFSAVKHEFRKPTNRTNSLNKGIRSTGSKVYNEKLPVLNKKDSQSNNKEINFLNHFKEPYLHEKKGENEYDENGPTVNEKIFEVTQDTSIHTSGEMILKHDNETKYYKTTDDKEELVILSKKHIASMTTTAMNYPLKNVTSVDKQLPEAFEKASEKENFETNYSNDSFGRDKINREVKPPYLSGSKSYDIKATAVKTFEENPNLKPLLPPYNNPQVERVKRKIDDIINTKPEVSNENIVCLAPEPTKNAKNALKNWAHNTKNLNCDSKNDPASTFNVQKKDSMTQSEKRSIENSPATSKIIDSNLTPVEEPKDFMERDIDKIKMEKEATVMTKTSDESVTETLVKEKPEKEVQSSNVSVSGMDLSQIKVNKKIEELSESDKSMPRNGRYENSFPETSSHHKQQSNDSSQASRNTTPQREDQDKSKICSRLSLVKWSSKCCPISPRTDDDKDINEKAIQDMEAANEKKSGVLSKLNFCRKKQNAPSAEFAIKTQHKRNLSNVISACLSRRTSAVSQGTIPHRIEDVTGDNDVVTNTRCYKKTRMVKRDSIASDRIPSGCCANHLTQWIRRVCRRLTGPSASRRQSMFSKNKSLSPTLPPEDTRKKLDPSLVEHTSVMRGAIPVLPLALAYLCLVCNILIPGLGTILSGTFCLCFGIPRFGIHDGAKHRIGSFVINLLMGCGQLFSLLFCLVGWGWSIWWGTIMVKIARKYRKLKAEEAAEEAERAPPVTANNHTSS